MPRGYWNFQFCVIDISELNVFPSCKLDRFITDPPFISNIAINFRKWIHFVLTWKTSILSYYKSILIRHYNCHRCFYTTKIFCICVINYEYNMEFQRIKLHPYITDNLNNSFIKQVYLSTHNLNIMVVLYGENTYYKLSTYVFQVHIEIWRIYIIYLIKRT